MVQINYLRIVWLETCWTGNIYIVSHLGRDTKNKKGNHEIKCNSQKFNRRCVEYYYNIVLVLLTNSTALKMKTFHRVNIHPRGLVRLSKEVNSSLEMDHLDNVLFLLILNTNIRWRNVVCVIYRMIAIDNINLSFIVLENLLQSL